jgi:hypothetical protein
MKASHSHSPVKHSLLVLGLVLSLVPVAVTPASAATEEPALLGMASSGDWRSDLDEFDRAAGKYPALFQLFWGLETDWTNSAWAAGMLSDLEARGVTAYVEITTTSLGDLNRGARDSQLNAMAKRVGDWLKANSSRKILIAPLPEMNLNHAWGGDPDGFQDGYRRIRNAFLNQGLQPEQIRFVFALNGLSEVGEYEDYYPGDSVVDLIGFAKINRGSPWRDYDDAFQTHIDELQARISLAKPILITQTGSVDVGGDRDKWLNEMFAGLKADDQVIGAIYFNRDKDGHDFRVLVNGSLDSTFNSGYQTWSDPSAVNWIFDGRMDAWVAERAEGFDSGFIDIQGHIFASSIIWLAEEGITAGCNPPDNTRFCPDDTVTRGQMAVFIARALGLPEATGDHFSDDSGEFYENAANQLFEAGITVGCATDRYCGEEPVMRGQMAAFLARTRNLPTTNQNFFIDDNGSTFEGDINRIADAGITLGCNPPANDRYCPGDFVTRGQMATFIQRALQR